MTLDKNRCVITGLGMICAIGNNVDETWENAKNGVSGIKNTTTCDTTDCYATLSAEVNDPTLTQVPNAENMDRVSQLCVKAATEAITDAGLDMGKEDTGRVSVIMGSCVGGVQSVEHYYKNDKPATDITKMTISAIANEVADVMGAGGVVTNIANACAAGTMSIAYSCDLIRAGKTDVAIAGGADCFASVPYAGFLSLHALDENGCSPFNHMHGITLGEGSAALVVESYEHAKARGAKIYCEVLGSGVATDAHHITAPREDGEGQMHAIEWGLAASGIAKSDIGYINAHGTGTGKNDGAEFLSIHTLFDNENDDLSVSSTKAMVGHCLGAAGSIEAVFAIKAMLDGVVPPTLGFSDEDLETLKERAGKLDFVPNKARNKEMKAVMSNSFAFGGNDASIIFSKEAGDVQCAQEKDIVITGLGLVNPFGNGIEKYVETFNAATLPVSTSVESAVGKEDFEAVDLKMSFYRKLDKFSQLQAVSGMAALKDAGITITDENAPTIGIAAGTAAGPLSTICDFQQNIIENGNAAGSAFKFPNTVYNAAGGYLSICAGIKGYNVTVTNGTQSGIQSIAYAAEVLRQNKEKTMLVSGTDEVTETMTELYTKDGKVASSVKKAYVGGDGYVLADGSISMILEKEDEAKARGAKVLAKVKGYGMSHKSVKFGTIAGSDSALVDAINSALEDAGLEASDIDAIVGFGNGDSTTDAIEIAGYDKVFGSAVPVVSVKDVTGEGRSSAATMAAAHAAMLLSGDYGLSGRAYKLGADKVEETVVDTASLKNILVTSFGVGGSYCAVVIGK